MKRQTRSGLASAGALVFAGMGFALMMCEPSGQDEMGGWVATMLATKAAGILAFTLALALMAPKKEKR